MFQSKYDQYKEEIISGKTTAKALANKIGNGCKETHIYAAKRRFLNPTKCKRSCQNWRKKYPEKVKERNQEYIKKHSNHKSNHRESWTDVEDALVLSNELAKNIAKKIGRTIKAVYSRRTFLRQQGEKGGKL